MSEVKQLDWLKDNNNNEKSASDIMNEAYSDQMKYAHLCQRITSDVLTQLSLDSVGNDAPEKNANDTDKDIVLLTGRIKSNAERIERLEQSRDVQSKNHKAIFAHIEKLEQDKNGLREFVNSHNLRIEKLECWASEEEKKADLAFENIDAKYELFSDRLVKLEERLRDLEDWTRKDEETIKGRIKKLERREGHLSQFEQDYQKSMDNIQVNLDRHLDMHNEHYQNHEKAMKEIQYLINSDDDELSKIGKEERQTGYLNALNDFYDMARQNLITDDESGALYVKYLISTFHKLKYEAESK